MLKTYMKETGYAKIDAMKLWKEKELYQQWTLDVFRGHVHQERDTHKYLYTLNRKAEELKQAKKEGRAKLDGKVDRYSKYHFDSSNEEEGNNA